MCLFSNKKCIDKIHTIHDKIMRKRSVQPNCLPGYHHVYTLRTATTTQGCCYHHHNPSPSQGDVQVWRDRLLLGSM